MGPGGNMDVGNVRSGAFRSPSLRPDGAPEAKRVFGCAPTPNHPGES